MNIRLLARQALRSFPVVLVTFTIVLFTLGVGMAAAATATATNEIEGIWSFSGGAVAIQPLPDGTFQGTVVSPTTFASCSHPVGQVMWTDMRPQTDGSFWGLHQWYHGAKCEENPLLGVTAWRVLRNSDGGRFLKVCFNSPGDTAQATIAPNGKETNVTYGCIASTPLAPLPTTEGQGSTSGAGSTGGGAIVFSQAVALPAGAACVSQTSLKIKLKEPRYDPFKEVVVKIGAKRVADVRDAKTFKKGIVIKRLPQGTYRVSVVAVTVLKQRLTGNRVYRACIKGSGKIGLRHAKTHRPHR